MNHILAFTTLIVHSFAFSQSSKDSIAIVQLIAREGRTWRMGDAKGHADCWQVRPYGSILVSTGDGKVMDMPPSAIVNPSSKNAASGGFAIHSNHKLSINGNSAWVSHDEVSISKEGKASHSKELRLLEKVSGNWKLVGQSLHIIKAPTTNEKKDTTSYIQTVDITTGDIETVSMIKDHFEAPNWHPNNYLILNHRGGLYTLDLTSKKMSQLNTGRAIGNNNDHGISPDKKWLAISNNDKSDTSRKSYKSAIFILPITGGEPRKITTEVPSYWHGWSMDGKTLAYCAERNGNYDIYTIDVKGGAEKRLTNTDGLDDGPDYSTDGKYIYFNSYRTGHMQIWRMHTDGSNPEQLTFDENSNWFAHPSPDNKWIVYISYTSDEKQSHLFGKQVVLRLMNLETKAIKDITPIFYGGQGTINVPSWSPDSKKIAFVAYSVN
ncbi:MAG: TolB family protein [Chitinophagaceae bacterium]